MEALTSVINSYKAASQSITWEMLPQFITIFLLSWVVYSHFLKIYFSPLKYMPRVTYVPIFGSLIDIIRQESGYYYESWMKRLNASVFRVFWAYGYERVCVADADVAKAILVTKTKSFRKAPEGYRFIKKLLGDGLVTTEGKLHRRNRKLCNGSFRKNILKNMIPTFESHTVKMMNKWEKLMETSRDGYTEIPINLQVTNLTFDVIGKCAFDYDFKCIENNSNETTDLFTKVSQKLGISWQRVLPDFLPFLHVFKTKSMKEYEKYISNLDKIVYSIIDEKRKTMDLSNEDDSNVNTLLESLLYAKDEDTGERMSDKEIRDHAVTFMLAGHETTAVSITWVLLQLARYPHIQDKVREEIRSVLPKDGRNITDDHLEQLSYLRCVIDETMRLYPAVLMVSREAVEDCRIGDYTFPKGTFLFVNITSLQKNPKYWENPMEFRPERFSDPSKVYPYSFIPFIAGGRMCIGYKFAIMEMKTALALLINEFEYKLMPGVSYKRRATITSRPEPNLILNVRKLN
ncbi:cytochrome P450 4X1-like [Octopus sinensis]|nr:cytochrome P450 4X1-like [Octopus sinensis]XP_029639204.1 cytochrome P450 4X1-like [Octopus sinensis]